MRKALGWRWGIAGLLLATTGAFALAGEHYTEYAYDADGRIEQVRTAVDDAPPVVASIMPGIVRRGPPVRVTVLGSSLRAAQVGADHPGLGVSAVTATATKITFDLTAAESVPLGAHVLTFSTVLGDASAEVTVRPRLPVLSVTPNPMALAPGGQQALALRLDSADVIDHAFQLASSNPAVATVAPGGVVIPAGALAPAGDAQVNALVLGTAALHIASDEIRDVTVPLFVTAPYQPPPGGASFHSLLLGLQRAAPPSLPVLIERGPFAARIGVVMPAAPPQGDGAVAPLAAPMLGLSVGSVVTSLVPRLVVRGAGATALTAHGVGLQAVTQVAVVPAEGVVASVVSAEEGAVQIAFEAGAQAAVGLRVVRLLDAQDVAVPATGLADRVLVSDPVPQLESASPQLLVRGAGMQSLTLRGSLLGGASAVSVLPPDGVSVGAQPVVAPDGRSLQVSVLVAADAPLGVRTLMVTTPAGDSDPQAGPANTVQVVSGIARTVSPVAAARVGLVFDGDGDGAVAPVDLRAPLLGLTVGPAFSGIAPRARSAGSAVMLQVFGHGLQAVESVALVPGDGIDVGAAEAAPDGTSLSVPLTIAANAPRSPRRVSLATTLGALAPASPEAALFLVTDAVPAVDSVAPMHLVRGAAVTVLTVRGQHFTGATAVAVSPGNGIAIGPPAVAPDGSALTVTIAAAEGAALGARVVTVTTPAGVSDALPSTANRLYVVDGIAGTVAPLPAARVGLQVGGAAPGAVVERLSVAPLLGVTVGVDAPPPPALQLLAGASVGIAVGPVLGAVSPHYLPVDGNVELQVMGVALQGVDAVFVIPPDGITVDAPPQIAPDGLSLSVPLGIDAAAPQVVRRIVASAGGVPLPESSSADAQVLVVGNQPLIASIEPIQVLPGQAFVLKVRGINLFGAAAVSANPATGLAIGNNPSVNGDGTEITVAVNVSANAPPGPRAIRVTAGGGMTAPEATPANTLHVVDDD